MPLYEADVYETITVRRVYQTEADSREAALDKFLIGDTTSEYTVNTLGVDNRECDIADVHEINNP